MDLGVPKETHRHEHRVGLTPAAVARLVQRGHGVLVESEAGLAARFTDQNYQAVGARIVYRQEEAYRRAEVICRVGQLAADEVELLRPGQTVCSWHHLAVARRELVERLMALGTTLIGYEVIRNERGELAALWPMSEMAGRLAVHLAAYYLQNEAGGRGILLGNVPGVPPPTVLILGAGTVGRTAARQALDSGAHVILVDADLVKLREANRELCDRAVTAVADEERLSRFTRIADVVIGAVLIPGSKAPFLVTEAMVRAMKPGSVVIDVSIDQGGCVETSRPTTPDHPTFVAHGVVHYCVPNMTAVVARTASRAMANAVVPYLVALADRGVDAALREIAGLAAGAYLYRGKVVNEGVGKALGLPVADLAGELGREGGA
jgi:alanine dehydrogenase